MDNNFNIDVAETATTRVLSACYKALNDFRVPLELTLLKPNMARSGAAAGSQSTPQEVAKATVRMIYRTVPLAVPGIFFLSGGMTEEYATLALDAINVQLGERRPWHVSFSYGRALQQSCLAAWAGEEGNKEPAQAALMLRAKANSLACMGQYQKESKL